jgi:phage I-like protein
MQSAPHLLRGDSRELVTSGNVVDPASAGVRLCGPSTYADGVPVRLVWVQIAETGRWEGHPSGSFEMTSATFDQIVRNFTARGLPVPWDFEHASEQDATSGTIPVHGAPAQGYVHRLDNRGPAGLWALVEWGELARRYIKTGQYKFCSPAIRFGCKDPVTGRPVGARLTSVALTSTPFLTGLGQLVAASDHVRSAPPREVPAVLMSLSALTRKLMIEEKLPYLDALDVAAKFIGSGSRR